MTVFEFDLKNEPLMKENLGRAASSNPPTEDGRTFDSTAESRDRDRNLSSSLQRADAVLNSSRYAPGVFGVSFF
jgi:hypothetical protein